MSDIFGGTIHYRSAFDAKCINPSWADAYPDLSKRVRTWAEDTLDVPRDTFKTREFLMGGTFRDLCPPRCSFETISRKYDAEGYAPNYWGCRITHPCSEFSYRHWSHDLTLSAQPGNCFRIAVTASHTIKGYLGEEPDAPEPFVPGIVQSVVTSRHWKCTSGDEVLSNVPVFLTPKFRALLKNAIANPNRKCPLVYVSVPQNSEVPMVDVDELANLLCGAAKVYVADTSEADPEVQEMLGEFSTWNGGIRVYQPGVNFRSNIDSKRHRFFSPGDIRHYGGDEVLMQIVRACCQRSTVLAQNELFSIESIVNVARRRRLHELMQASNQESDSELLELATELEQQLSSVQSENQRLKEALEFTTIERVEGEKDKSQLQFELKTQIESTQDAFRRLKELERASASMHLLAKLPSTIAEVLTLVCEFHADRLICLPEALKSAEESRYRNVGKAWELLWSLADVLHPMLFEPGVDSVFSEKEYENRTGFRITMNEGRMTQRDSKLMRMRERQYEGKLYDISPHVSLNKGSLSLRVHFAIEQDSKKLIIGHCGDHLDTFSTQKLS